MSEEKDRWVGPVSAALTFLIVAAAVLGLVGILLAGVRLIMWGLGAL